MLTQVTSLEPLNRDIINFILGVNNNGYTRKIVGPMSIASIVPTIIMKIKTNLSVSNCN